MGLLFGPYYCPPITSPKRKFDMKKVIGICAKCLNFGMPCPGLIVGIPNGLQLTKICYIKKTGDEDKDAEKRITLELESIVTQMMELQNKEDKLHGKLAKVQARIQLKEGVVERPPEGDPFPFFQKSNRPPPYA